MIYFLQVWMTKKDYIIKLLDSLVGYWPLARWLKILVEWNALDDNGIDAIYNILSSTVSELKDAEVKAKIQKSMAFIAQLKESEAKQQELDQQDIARLDDLLKDI